MGALDDKPFGIVTTDDSRGDKGEAIKRSKRWLGDPATDMKYEGEPAHEVVSAAQMNNVGRE